MPGQPDPASPDGGRPRPLAKVAQDAAEGRASAARARGAVAWFSTTGADLLGLLPEGYDIGLDLAGETPLRLRPSALRPVVEVSWG